jgi:O-antigen/teichoic acid export membrane protein
MTDIREMFINPTPLLAETRDFQNEVSVEDESSLEIDTRPTLLLPIINLAQSSPGSTDLPTYAPQLSSLLSFLDELPIEEQATWYLPVVTVAKKAKVTVVSSSNQDIVSLVRNLIKNSGIYALASLASPFVSLLLTPFLAYHLTRTDYGTLAVLTTAISLVAGVTQLGLGSAFFRAYSYDYESKRDRSDVMSNVVLLLLLVTVPTVIVTILVGSEISMLLFGTSSLNDTIRLSALVILLQNLTIPGLSWFRAENRAFFFSILSVASVLATLGANIVLVGVLHMGITGSLLAMGIGYMFITICTLPAILLFAGINVRPDIVKGLLTFGLPNVANFVSVWILQLSDRFLLSRIGTLSQTASYAVGYSLGGVLSSLVIAPFSLAWPSVMFAIAKRDDAAAIFRLVFRWYVLVLLFAAFGLALADVAVLTLFFPPAYASAASIIPVISTSIMFYGIYIIFTVGISVQRKTWLAVIFTTISALVNVGLNLILIRPYGAMGAALSTLLAYVVLAGVAYVVNQQLYPIAFELKAFAIALFLGISLYIGSDFLAQGREVYTFWAIHIFALCLYAGCLILLGKVVGRNA